jgi:hypothetical protein
MQGRHDQPKGAGSPLQGNNMLDEAPRILLVSVAMDAKPKPYVQIAAFCEQLLQENDGVLTPIRIVDTYTLEVPPDLPKGALPAIEVKGMIALKSGEVSGEHVIKLVMQNTQGVRSFLSPDDGWPVVFKGEEKGVQIKLRFQLGVKNFGLCWFDVLFDDELLTRMPLRLQRQEKSEETSSPT